MKFLRQPLAFLLAMLMAVGVLAQAYPSTNPTYIPAAILNATTMTAAGTTAFQVNGQGTVLLRVAGTNSVMSATVEISDTRAGTPAWTAVGIQNIGTGGTGAIIGKIVANGLYRVNVSGAAQMRFNLASFTGTNVIVSGSGGAGVTDRITTVPFVRNTYASAQLATPAASPTDFVSLTGASGITTRVLSAGCTGFSTTAGAGQISAVRRYAANTGGTTVAGLAVQYDSAAPSASATPLFYTANPTVGALAGTVATGHMALFPVGSAASSVLNFVFGNRRSEQEVVLRSATDVFALNGAATTFPAGTALRCTIVWTEE